MKKYLIGAQQVIQYEFEIEIPDDMTPQDFLKGHTVDHDTLLSRVNSNGGYPNITDWELPEYIEIKLLEE